jgi:hypothetical protein
MPLVKSKQGSQRPTTCLAFCSRGRQQRRRRNSGQLYFTDLFKEYKLYMICRLFLNRCVRYHIASNSATE